MGKIASVQTKSLLFAVDTAIFYLWLIK